MAYKKPKHTGTIKDCIYMYQMCMIWCHEWTI